MPTTKLLIVDDEYELLEELVEFFTGAGFSCVSASNATDAIKYFNDEPAIGIVITDLWMPDQIGTALIKTLKAHAGPDRHFESMLLTGHGSENDAIEALRIGIGDYHTKPLDLEALLQSVHDLEQRLTERRRLQRLAVTDSLTGLPNRRHFMQRATEELERTRRYGTPTSVLMLDIDHFKAINDTWGHTAGDETLQQLASSLRSLLRKSDIPGRLGGEEFALLLPSTNPDSAGDFAERLRSQLKVLQVARDGQQFGITVSIGVSAFSPDDRSPGDALARADAAMLEAKRAGRDRVLSSV